MGKKCIYSLGQNIVDKFVKLSNICFSIECFTAGILQICCATVKICFGPLALYFLTNAKYFSGFLEISLFPES